ncbi:MAG: hypothetical protein ACOH2E_06015 [Candidatus Paracaedibacter sp.]
METSAARKIFEELRSRPPLGIQKYDDNYLGRPQFYFEKLIQESSGIFWEILELEKTALCRGSVREAAVKCNLDKKAIKSIP